VGNERSAPKGYYNLGVAHGIAGIIHLLNQVSTTPVVSPAQARQTTKEAEMTHPLVDLIDRRIQTFDCAVSPNNLNASILSLLVAIELRDTFREVIGRDGEIPQK
jgi:hypothetical protein